MCSVATVAESDFKARNSSPEKTSRGSTWIVLAVLVVLGVQSAWLFWWRDRAVVKAGNSARIRSVLHLESFVLNLADPEGKAYLRVGIDLGLENPLKSGDEQGGSPVAMVRDTILGRLSLAKPDELLTSDGKAKLKESLLQALRERAPELGVQEVYFTEFLIQR